MPPASHERRKAYALRRIAEATSWHERRQFIAAHAALTMREWDSASRSFPLAA